MKKTFVLTLAIISIAFLLNSFRNGPANRGHDKTGSPLSNGMCMNCHSSGSFSPEIQVKMFDGVNEVTSYDPGKMYTLQYLTTTTGDPSAFGFQTVALNGNNENAGSFDDLPDGFQLVSLNGADYVEHGSPRPSNTFEVSWTAPANAAEEITIYAAGIAANANGGTSGDGGDTTKLVLQPNTSGLDMLSAFDIQLFSLKSNTTSHDLTAIQPSGTEWVHYTIVSQNGHMIRQFKKAGTQTKHEFDIQTSELMPGLYFLSARSGSEIHTERFYRL